LKAGPRQILAPAASLSVRQNKSTLSEMFSASIAATQTGVDVNATGGGVDMQIQK